MKETCNNITFYPLLRFYIKPDYDRLAPKHVAYSYNILM